jgi:phenylalanyl-tRNA synthetase beta chain
MRAPTRWLASLCDSGLAPERLAERLSMTGTEVERIGHSGAPAEDGFVVGRVLSAEQHPNADRLRVCEVDAGGEGPRTIVCGAPNVAAGQAVAVALPGAVLPGGQRLGEAKLRGVLSSGMILSEAELEAGEDASGIAVLATDAAPGTPLAELVPVGEPVLELEVTPNRPDCLGLYGIAREVHAITVAPLAPEPWAQDAEPSGPVEVGELATVEVRDPDLCPRFTARAFTEVTVGPSPLWLKQRLIAAGQRPINNVVDITNYVMLLTGQPLHAFDLDRIRGGGLIIRRAAEGERMVTLDGVERRFDGEAMLVCDQEGPSGIAGIMGGQVSEVSEGTNRVLLEAATWDGANVLATSGKLGLRSEASTRFEKGLHPELTMRAQRIASQLLIELCGARLIPGTIDVAAPGWELRTLTLRTARMRSLLGMEVPVEDAVVYLRRLGFGAEAASEEAISVTVPADRYFDVTREIDLIEEVARVHGIDEHLPATLPDGAGVGGLAPHAAHLRRAEDLLCDLGLDEAVSWSFVAPDQARRLGLGSDAPEPIRVHNPLSEENSRMRTTLLANLLDAAAHNLARGSERVALFESGRVYLPETAPSEGGVLDGRFAGTRPAPAREPHRIAAVVVGALTPPSWREQPPPADFYVAKGLLERLAAELRCRLAFEPDEKLPFLRPGRAARLLVEGRSAGWVGELHPRVAEEWDLPPGVAFELDAGPLIEAAGAGRELYEDVTSFPAVLEDLAVVAPDSVPAAAIEEAVRIGGGELLRSVRIFDVYSGEQVGAGRRSLALRLEFRAPDRTLADEDVAAPRERILGELELIGAELRG